ncbi:hypothetical protein D3C78_1884730 [compost metagenome]
MFTHVHTLAHVHTFVRASAFVHVHITHEFANSFFEQIRFDTGEVLDRVVFTRLCQFVKVAGGV